MSLPYVTAPLEPFKERCLFVSAIDNSVLAAGGNAFVFGHPAKKEAALTGTLTTGAFATSNTNHVSEVRADAETTGGANGPSVEQVIGAYLRNGQASPSVNLAVDGGRTAPWEPADTLNSNFFFESRGNAITLEARPRAAFDRLFANVMTTAPGSRRHGAAAATRAQQERARRRARELRRAELGPRPRRPYPTRRARRAHPPARARPDPDRDVQRAGRRDRCRQLHGLPHGPARPAAEPRARTRDGL
jgi:hypothetical protein